MMGVRKAWFRLRQPPVVLLFKKFPKELERRLFLRILRCPISRTAPVRRFFIVELHRVRIDGLEPCHGLGISSSSVSVICR
jgi:hypothetical protein